VGGNPGQVSAGTDKYYVFTISEVVDSMPKKNHVIDYERWTGGEMEYTGEAIGFTYNGKWY
jgi:hypothetical protein